eukprot:scaffold82322_cov66-Phaeocystis_antarctica.AAC.7
MKRRRRRLRLVGHVNSPRGTTEPPTSVLVWGDPSVALTGEHTHTCSGRRRRYVPTYVTAAPRRRSHLTQ